MNTQRNDGTAGHLCATAPHAGRGPADITHNRRRWLIGAGALVLAGAGRAEVGVNSGEILLGQTLGLKGGTDTYAQDVEDGVLLMAERVNREGGIHGRKLVIKVLDDAGDSAKAAANARALVQQHGVFALFGPLEGGPSTAVMQVATELKVPLLGPMAGSPVFRLPYNPLVFPVRTEHRDEFQVILRHAGLLGLGRIGFFRSDTEVGRLHLANVQRLSQEFGLQVSADLAFGSNVTDAALDEMVAQMKSAGVQAVLNHGSVGVYERLIRRARAAGLATVFYGVNSGSSTLAAKLGPLAVGMAFTQIMPNPRSGASPLARAFRQVYDRERPHKEPSYGTLEGYVTAWVAAEALRLAGPSPTRQALVQRLQTADIALPGITVSYRPGMHAGMKLVDLAIVDRDAMFRH